MNTAEIKISFWGDFAGQGHFNDCLASGHSFDMLGEMVEHIQESDISVVNLEAPVLEGGEKIPKSGPNIQAPIHIVSVLKAAGVTLVSLANNHIMDYGEAGLLSTINACRSCGLDYTGVGLSEMAAATIKYISCQGKNLAFVAVAENEFGTAHGNDAGGAPLDPVKNYYKIIEARHNADYVFVMVHGGHETFEYPSLRMRNTYRFFIDVGADAVIGHHTHCFSGHEIYHNKPIVYSLGNFVFDNGADAYSSWNEGVGAVLTLKDHSVGLSLIPFTQGLPDHPQPRHFSEEHQKRFFDQAQKMANIIGCDELLQIEFEKFVSQSEKKYSLYLEPFSNKILLGLISRGWLRSFVKGKKRLLLLNIIRCEAHRDILLQILKK